MNRNIKGGGNEEKQSQINTSTSHSRIPNGNENNEPYMHIQVFDGQPSTSNNGNASLSTLEDMKNSMPKEIKLPDWRKNKSHKASSRHVESK